MSGQVGVGLVWRSPSNSGPDRGSLYHSNTKMPEYGGEIRQICPGFVKSRHWTQFHCSYATWPIYLISIRFGNPWPRFWSYSGHDNSKLNSIPVQRSKIQFRREIIANNCSMNLTFWPTCKIIRKEKSQESILLIIFINVTQGELVNFERNFHQVVYKVASLLSGRQFWKEFTYPDLNKRIATWK